MMTDHCVSCGREIPEGRQCCPICYALDPKELIEYLNNKSYPFATRIAPDMTGASDVLRGDIK